MRRLHSELKPKAPASPPKKKAKKRRRKPRKSKAKARNLLEPVLLALRAIGGYERLVTLLLEEAKYAKAAGRDPCEEYGPEYWWRRAVQMHHRLLAEGGTLVKLKRKRPFPVAPNGKEQDLPGLRDLENRDCVHFESCLGVAARCDAKSVCGGRVKLACSQYLSRDGDWQEEWKRMMVNSDALGLGGYDEEEWGRNGE